MEQIKKISIDAIEILIDVLIYFVFLWSGVLAITFTYALPKKGIEVLICSVMMVIIPKIITKFKNKKEV